MSPNGDTNLAHSVLRIRPFHTKKAPPEPPMGVNTQEGLAQSDETGNVQNPVGGQVVQLETIGVQQATNKRVQWKSKSAREESLEAYLLVRCRSRNWLVT